MVIADLIPLRDSVSSPIVHCMTLRIVHSSLLFVGIDGCTELTCFSKLALVIASSWSRISLLSLFRMTRSCAIGQTGRSGRISKFVDHNGQAGSLCAAVASL